MTSPIASRTRWPWFFVLAFALGHTFIDFYAGLNVPLLSSFEKVFELNTRDFFAYVMPATIFGSLLQPFLGIVGDRFNKGILVGIALLLASTFHSLIGTAQEPIQLTLYLTLGGLGVGLFHPCAAAAVSNIVPERRNLVMSIFLVFGMTGLGVSYPFVAWFVQVDDAIVLSRTWLLAPVGLGVAVLMFLSTPFSPSSRITGSADTSTVLSTLRDFFSPGFRTVRQLWVVAFIRAFVMIVFQSMGSYLVEHHGWDIIMGGRCLGAMTVCFGIGGLFGGYLSDRNSPRKVFLTSTIMPTPFLLMAAMSHHPWLTFSCYAAAGIFFGLANPLTVVFAQKLQPDRPGLVSGLMLGFAWGVSGILMPLVGQFKDDFGVPSTLCFAALLLLPALLFALRLPLDEA